jgi:hypothetical protein
MDGEISPIGFVILIVWMAAGGYAVRPFLRESKTTLRNVALFIVGFAMLALGALSAVTLIRIFFL